MTTELALPEPLSSGLTAADHGRVADALASSRSASTRLAYASAWRGWETWCSARGASPLPAVPELLAAYLAERASTGCAVSTLDKVVAAVRAVHLDAGHDDPTGNRGVVRVRAGLRRAVGVAPRRQAHPITTEEVRRIVVAIDPTSLRGKRDRALILLGYAAALRRSEIVGLLVRDVSMKPAGLVIHVRRSKGDQDSAGQVIGVTRGQHAETDPVTAVRAWFTATGLQPGDPLFSLVARSDLRVVARHLEGKQVNRILTARAAAAGLADLALSGHSLRAGHATTAAEHGVPADRLARTTRHANLATLAKYIRPAEVLADTSSSSLDL
jgi:integrase